MTQFISSPTTINGTTSGAVISGQTFSGSVTNAGTISAGGLIVSASDLTSGSLVNADTGTIVGGIALIGSTIDGQIVDDGFLSGGISIDSASKIAASSEDAIDITGATFLGGISNAGAISAGDYGIFVESVAQFGPAGPGGGIVNSGTISAGYDGIDAINVTDFSGGISNAGAISAGQYGIFVESVAQFGSAGPGGGIVNSGTISAGDDGIDAINVTDFSGGISNAGAISADYDGIDAISVTDFSGGISNAGAISAFYNGIYLNDVTTFPGNIVNLSGGTISAGQYGIFVESVAQFGSAGPGGGIVNSGTIVAGDYGIYADANDATFTGGITNAGVLSASYEAVSVGASYAIFTGGITNAGVLASDDGDGIDLYGYAGTFSGAIVNLSGGTISAGDGFGIYVSEVAQFGSTAPGGGIVNSGTIVAGADGIDASEVANFSGGITNVGTISAGETGIEVIDTATFVGGIINTGTISGGGTAAINVEGTSYFSGSIVNVGSVTDQPNGILIWFGQTFDGGVTNVGTVSVDGNGIYFENEPIVTGDIVNSAGGLISAGGNGVQLNDVYLFSGSVINSGTISAGATGVAVTVGTLLSGTISNAGSIRGAVGMSIIDSTVAGAIDDSGAISGRVAGILVDQPSLLSAATGDAIAVTGPTFTGGIDNAGTISAATGAGVFVGGVADFGGGITNTGTVAGAVGIVLSSQPNVDVVDAGTIDGTGGTAVVFDGAPDTLTLEQGYGIGGAVLGGGGILQLGGAGTDSFDLSSVGSGQQYSGFGTLEVVGGTWSATGSGQDWQIDGGTLDVASGTVLSGAAVSAGGTLDVQSAGSALAATVLSGGATLVESGGSAAGVTIDGRGTLDLQTSAAAGGIVFAGSGGTLAIDGSGAPLSAYVSTLAIAGLAAGDLVDLTGVAYSAGATASSTSSALDVTVGGTTYAVGLTSTSFAGDHFVVTSDGNGGTFVFIATSQTVSRGHVVFYSGTSDEGDVVSSGGTLVVTSGAILSNTTVSKGGVLIIEGGGTDIGLVNSGTIVGQGGVLSGVPGAPIVNDGIVDPSSGTNTYLKIVGDYVNASGFLTVASATGSGSLAQLVFAGGTLTNSGTVEAIATAATTSAVVNLTDSAVVGPGRLLADGNAAIYIDGANISGGSLQTIGANAFIGVMGGAAGSAGISGATISKNTAIFDDGTLAVSGGSAGTAVKFLAQGEYADLTLSAVSLAGGDSIIATSNAVLTVAASSGGSSVFSAGTVVEAEAGAAATLFGSVVNSGTVNAFASAGYGADIAVSAGSDGIVTNAKGGVIEAQAIASYQSVASAYVSAGGALLNSGTIKALAASGFENGAFFTLDGGSIVNAATGVIDGFAMSNGNASLTLSAVSGLTNSGAVVASAGGESEAGLNVYLISGGTASNTKTIEALASGDSDAYLALQDDSGSGSLVNAKGATIETAVTGSGSYGTFEVSFGGAIANSGTIAVSAANGASASGNEYLDGGSLTNAGTIAVAASAESSADLVIDITSGVLNSGTIAATASAESSADLIINITSGVLNSGTIAATASDSYVETDGSIGFDGSLTNSGSMTATATADGDAYHGWTMDGGAFVNAATMKASATGSGSEAAFGVVGFGSGTNSGTIAATAANRSEANVDIGFYSEYRYAADGGESFTNTKVISASEVQSSIAQLEIDVVGSGGSNAVINNTSALAAVANGGGFATLDLYAVAYGTQTFTYDANGAGARVENTGTITATATAGAEAGVDVLAAGSGASIVNGKLIEASAAGGTAFLYVFAHGTSNTISNTGTIEASAAGGIAYVGLGGQGYAGAVVNNSGGTLLATATAGTAYFDLGYGDANVSGGTLKTVGANADLGAIDGGYASATDVAIANGTRIVAWDGIMELDSLAGPISAGVLIQGAKNGTVVINGAVTNSGTIEALGNFDGRGSASISGGAVTNAANGVIEAAATSASIAEVQLFGSIANSGTILANGAADSYAWVSISGSVINTSTGVLSATGDGAIILDGAVVSGGKLVTTGSAAAIGVDDGWSGTVAGATIVAGAQVYAEDGGTLTLGDGTVVSGKGATVAVVGADEFGIVIVSGAVTNYGTILAGGNDGPGTVEIASGAALNNVSRGMVEIGQDGTVVVDSGGSVGAVTFGPNDNGFLELADQPGDVAAFSGSVVGFGGVAGAYPDQEIVLDQVAYAPGTFSASYIGTSKSGTLEILSAGGTAAEIDLVGNYVDAGFVISSGPGGFVAISDPINDHSPWPAPSTVAGAGNPSGVSTGVAGAALLGSYMASLFAATEGQVGAPTAEAAQAQAVLAHPHTG